MEESKISQAGQGLLKELSFYRSLILDAVEQEAHASPGWAVLRKRLLTCLGERGLEGSIRTFINQTKN